MLVKGGPGNDIVTTEKECKRILVHDLEYIIRLAPVPTKQSWRIGLGVNSSQAAIMDDDVTTIKDSKTKHCAYVIRYTLYGVVSHFFLQICCIRISQTTMSSLYHMPPR